MELLHYKPTHPVTLDPKPPRTRAKSRKKRIRGITFPAITGPDTGILKVHGLTAAGTRYKLWYGENSRRRYISLPAGTSLDEARTRRDNLFKNLKELHGGKPRKLRETEYARKKHVTVLKPDSYIYERPGFFVKILGKQIGAAYTREEAQALRDKWIAENPEKVPHLVTGGQES